MIPALTPLRRYFDFSGRSDRTEFWSFMLLVAIVVAIGEGLRMASSWRDDWLLADVGRLLEFFALLFFPIPMLALTVRRLHDLDESGWYSIIAFIPLGVFVLFPMMLLPGSEEENRYG
ncbi:uncharacterized membrane protein YhaH (DUF805 family) [Stenotrophomonas sp. AN71]|uniref:DUF805 domain-containing protein n=1 Tax=Stenotrophomonas sp. AN71 TaxID=3156253 RepID=UPI003D1C135D